jgi:protein-tyrosine phosphatase
MTPHPYFALACPESKGQLFLTPCPGSKGINLKDSLGELKNAGATVVITLMPEPEMRSNSVARLPETCAQLGLTWIHIPVEDEGAPNNEFTVRWQQAGPKIHQRLDNNENIVIHCKGGSGRTGVLAAQILMERGAPMQPTLVTIKALRPNAFVHAVQVNYISTLQNKL